jgi:serine/threonine-protein kinase
VALVQRFRHEAEAIAQLRHPHVIPIYSVGGEGSIGYFVMPKVDGESLASLLSRESQLSVQESCRIVREAASALSVAHRAGIIHRDIKPENILLDGPERRVLVMDFGIAKSLDSSDKGLTGTGMLVGTPQYMSPEQAAGDRTIDHRSDQYALATVGYRMLTGHLPFDGDSVQTVIFKQVTEPPRPISETAPAVPAAVAAVIERALAKRPEDRFESMDAFGSALDKALQDASTSTSARVRVPNMAARIDSMRRALPGWRHPLTIAGLVAAIAALALGPRTVYRSAYQHAAARDDAVFAARSFLAGRGVSGSLDHFAEFRTRDTLSLHRFLLATIGGRAVEARVAKDLPFWTWRVHLKSAGETVPWNVDLGLGNRVVGFSRQLPDTASAPRVATQEAEPAALGELATRGWSPASLRRLSDSTITRSNRTDHIFRWARPESAIPWGNDTAFAKVSVRVTGNDVTGYSEFLETPLRYRQQHNTAQQTAALGLMVILLVLAGIAIGFGLLISRSRRDELQWRLGWRLGLGVCALSAPTYYLTNFAKELIAPSNPDAPLALGIVGGVAIGAFIFGMVFLGSVLAESLSAEHRPAMFGGVPDLSKGRLMNPELVSAVAFGAIWGFVLAAAEQVVRFAGLLITGTHGSAGASELVTASIPALKVLDNFASSVALCALLACLQLVLYHWRRSPALAIGGGIVIVAVINFLVPDQLMILRINSVVGIVLTSFVLWRYGFLTALLATFISETVAPLWALFWSGSSGGMAGALLAALVFVAPFALGIVAYRRLSANPQGAPLKTR